MACTTADLLAAAKCFLCIEDEHLQGAVVVRLLCALRDRESVPCDPTTLMADAKCIACAIPRGFMTAAMIPVLCAVVAGGGLASVQVYQGVFVDPNGNVTPSDPTKPALYFKNGGGTLWQFDVPSQTWV